jgi:5-methylcytosine-specific restriction endonuclease McrA
MGPRKRKEYTDALWEDEASLLRVYFNNKLFFLRQLETEINKLLGDFPLSDSQSNIIGEEIALEDMPLYDWKKYAPDRYDKMKAAIFFKARQGEDYVCAECGEKSPHKWKFQIDHIYPMSKGGKTKEENLQLLCRSCNLRKSDKI